MNKAGKPIQKYLVSFVLVVLLLGCAKSISPPGGAIDKTPPSIESSLPAINSVSVPLESEIAITFSEKIDARSVERAVFITPRIDPDPKIKTSGNTITISPQAPLKQDRTYVVTLGTDLKDSHGVRLKRALTLAFSTGPTLDTGIIAGTIYNTTNTPAANISVALFEDLPQSDTIVVDSLKPDYITQSGSDGAYVFRNIPPQKYFLVAFNDANKNRRINPAREMIGLPANIPRLDTLVTEIENLNIALSKKVDCYISFKSIALNKDNLLRIRLNRPIDESLSKEFIENLSITSPENTRVSINEFSPLSDYPCPDYIIITEALDSVEYTVSTDLKTHFADVPDSLREISYSFTPKGVTDAAGPTAVNMSPGENETNVYPTEVICILFSEPVEIDPARDPVHISQAGDTFTVAMTPVNRFEYTGIPAKALSFGTEYQLHINGPAFIDASGNVYSDSLKTLTFSTIGLDTLGTISGGIQYAESQNPIHPVSLTFNPVDGGVEKTIQIQQGQLEFLVDLLPGFYTISGYIDNNENGSYDFGTIIPYVTAEPFTAPVDTLRVRSRFVTEGAVVEF